MKITIIDYGAGNIRNVFRAIDQLGVKPIISADPKDILAVSDEQPEEVFGSISTFEPANPMTVRD